VDSWGSLPTRVIDNLGLLILAEERGIPTADGSFRKSVVSEICGLGSE